MKKAIVIFQWNRPRYLYVTLDSLFRAKQIDNYDVFVWIDGEGKGKELKTVAAEFNITDVFIRKKRLKSLFHKTTALKSTYDFGYDEILHFDGDCILRRDALEYIDKQREKAFIISLIKAQKKYAKWYSSLGVYMNSERFNQIFEYVISFEFVNKSRPGHIVQKFGKNIDYNFHTDSIYCRFMIDNDKYTKFADKHYIVHFGISGLHNNNKKLEKELFKGEKDRWITNAIDLVENYPYKAFVPKRFEYG